MDQSKWPHNHESVKCDTNIAWRYATPEAYKALTVKMVKAMDEADIKRLMIDQSYRSVMLSSASTDVVAALRARNEGRPVDAAPFVFPTKTKKDGIKEELRDELTRVNIAAMDNDNLTAQIQIIKLRAELESLLNKKETEEDKVITINVITGIDRDA